MNSKRCSLGSLITLVGAVFGLPSNAQTLDCGADDKQCLERIYVTSCREQTSDQGSCAALIRSIEEHEFSAEPEWLLIAGSAYFSLAEMAEWAGSRDEMRRFLRLSRDVYREIIQRWPTGYYASEAYIGLSTTAEEEGESIEFLRNAVLADPTSSFAAEAVARELARRGETSDYAQAAEYLHGAYTALSVADPDRTNLKRWHLAASAIGFYEWSGQVSRAVALRDEVYQDSGMALYAAEVLSDRFTDDINHVAEVFEVACWAYIIGLFGSDTCLNGIDTVAAAVAAFADGFRRRQFVDVASEAMRSLLAAEETQENRDRVSSVLRVWIEGGLATAEAFVRYSEVAPDEETWLWALENAVRLEPTDGRNRYWLAGAYLELERFDEAIEHFELSRRDLPEEFSEEILDAQIQRAREAREQTLR